MVPFSQCEKYFKGCKVCNSECRDPSFTCKSFLLILLILGTEQSLTNNNINAETKIIVPTVISCVIALALISIALVIQYSRRIEDSGTIKITKDRISCKKYSKLKQYRRLKVVVVANNAENKVVERKRYKPLKFAEKTAQDFLVHVKNNWGVDDRDIFSCFGKAATVEQIGKIPDWVKANVDVHDQLVIYVCGHGRKKIFGSRYVAWDGTVDFNELILSILRKYKIQQGGVNLFRNVLTPPKSIVVITDFCFSYGSVASMGNQIRNARKSFLDVLYRCKNWRNKIEYHELPNGNPEEAQHMTLEMKRFSGKANLKIEPPESFRESTKQFVLVAMTSSLQKTYELSSLQQCRFSHFLFKILFENPNLEEDNEQKDDGKMEEEEKKEEEPLNPGKLEESQEVKKNPKEKQVPVILPVEEIMKRMETIASDWEHGAKPIFYHMFEENEDVDCFLVCSKVHSEEALRILYKGN